MHIHPSRSRFSRSGSTLAITLSIAGILVVLILALQYTGTASRAALLAAEARFQAEVEANNSEVMLAEGLSRNKVDGVYAAVGDTATTDSKVYSFNMGLDPTRAPDTVNLVLRGSYQAPPVTGFGGKIFSQPDVMLANSNEAVPTTPLNGQTLPLPRFTVRLDCTRSSTNRALAAAAARSYQLLLQPHLPYAIYAPRGTITLTSAKAFTNPTFEQVGDNEPEAAKYLSGFPVNLLAFNQITVTDDFPYGEARLLSTADSATIQITGDGLATKGLPNQGKAVYTELAASLEAAKGTLRGVAFDKTDTVFGRPMSSVTDVVGKLFKGDNLGSFFTLQQAAAFYFIIIPQFQTIGDGLLVKLHLPFAPDQSNNGMNTARDDVNRALSEAANLKKMQQDQQTKTDEANALGGQARTQQTKIDTLQATYDRETANIASLNQTLTQQKASLDSLNKNKDATQAQKDAAQAAVDATQKQLNDLTATHTRTGNQLTSEKAVLQGIKDQIDLKKAEIDSLDKQIADAKSKRNSDAESAFMSFVDPGEDLGPLPKDEDGLAKKDAKYKENQGQTGFSYGKLLGRFAAGILKALKAVLSTFPLIRIHVDMFFFSFDIILPDFPKIPAWIASLPDKFMQAMKEFFDTLVGSPVCLIAVGDDLARPFTDDSTFLITQHFTVPAGRTLRITKSMKGYDQNVWVQRGACLIVDGNLDLLTSVKEFVPKVGSILRNGNLCLSEGATVVVGGNLTCTALKMCSPVGQVRGINRAVFCGGSLIAHMGTSSAVTYDDLIRFATGRDGFADFIRYYYEKVLPNLAKLPYLGPFHARKPYFSCYPTTICVLFFPPCAFPAPLPEGSNIHNTLFKFLSYVFAVHLDLAMGDNYMMAARVWKGPVPFLPKTATTVVVNEIKSKVG